MSVVRPKSRGEEKKGDFLPLPLALPSPPGKWRVCLQAIEKIVNVFGRITVICCIVFYVMLAMREVPHLDSNAYLFSKKRKDQISLKQHRLQSAYLQPLLVQWDLHTTNFYHNEVFPPVTVKNIENNQDKRNPVNPFVLLRYAASREYKRQASSRNMPAFLRFIWKMKRKTSQPINSLE